MFYKHNATICYNKIWKMEKARSNTAYNKLQSPHPNHNMSSQNLNSQITVTLIVTTYMCM